MALKEKKIVQEVLVCDLCGTDIADAQGTEVHAEATGYIKKNEFKLDLCADCASKIGLKRRGRKPAEQPEANAAPKRRGRPRKNPEKEPEKALVAVGGRAKDDDGWEDD